MYNISTKSENTVVSMVLPSHNAKTNDLNENVGKIFAVVRAIDTN